MTAALSAQLAGMRINGYHQALDIEPGDVLVRVYDRSAAVAGGWTASTWNPTRPPANAKVTNAGRFDLLPSDPDPGGFLYCAHSGSNEQVAIAETFRGLMKRDGTTTNRRILSRSDRDARSIHYFEVNEPVSVVDLRLQKWRECFQMEEDILYSKDRSVTRLWAQFVKEQVPGAAGIAFNSTQATSHLPQASFVLWESRFKIKTFTPLKEISFASPEGRTLLMDALSPSYSVLMVP